jgi:hypothetical protein
VAVAVAVVVVVVVVVAVAVAVVVVAAPSPSRRCPSRAADSYTPRRSAGAAETTRRVLTHPPRRRKLGRSPCSSSARGAMDRLELLETLHGHSDRVWSVAWAPDGEPRHLPRAQALPQQGARSSWRSYGAVAADRRRAGASQMQRAVHRHL